MTSHPPLLQIMEGRPARPRKAPRERPKELSLHVSIVKLLRDHGREDWQWCHPASGEKRDARTGAKLKAMGVKPGWPDIILISPSGQFHGLEFKRRGGSLSGGQESFATWCVANNIPHVVARTSNEALAALDAWGALRIKIARPE